MTLARRETLCWALALISIEGMKFNPPSIVVHPGDNVQWKNKDVFPHTVTSDARGKFDSKEIPAGGLWTLKITRKMAGSFPYKCGLHPTMTGTLDVSRK